MAKILRQNVGGIDFTMAGCALTGVCPTAAADYVKQITLSDGDVIEDGMMMVVTFANGNTAGNAPGTKTIYSSDQVNYYEDDQLTVPFTLAPEGCYEIEYTGTANAYTYTDYPIFQVGSVSGPVCDYRGHITSGDLWNAGDSVQCMLKEGKFLLLGGSGGANITEYSSKQAIIDDLPNLSDGQYVSTPDTGDEMSQPVDAVESGNLHAVTSNAVHKVLFPDYASGNILTEQIPSSGYTVPVDCWCNFLLIANTAGERRLNIDGVIVGNVDDSSNIYVFTFSGFIKAGSLIKRNDNSVINTNQIQLYRLMES